ncbi:MAG: UDP-N-acetylmuramoyl-tripeptide--D-alanyl-D-alanine ligase [Mariprofundaceae bacterium]|nr:UDP-N-acetylmuramoyl-tripeptide--D-alanyl-D-alanine ligase [Mariprofundaceae bacterium]
MLNTDVLEKACGGRWLGACPEGIGRICTDSRNLQQGDVFIALRGPSFDGHAFGAQVANRALALIGDSEGIQQWKGLAIPQLEVGNTLDALGHIAHAYRCELRDTCVMAITGSYGKTTVRAMLAYALNRLGIRISATTANNNNLIGVPQTLLSIPKNTDVALVECGISEAGEMARLSNMVSPDMAILTGIGLAHGAGLGSLASIAVEKYRLIEALRDHGLAIFGDGVAAHLSATATMEHDGKWGDEKKVQWRLTASPDDKRKATVILQWQGNQARVNLALPAPHWAANMALVATVVLSWATRYGRSIGLSEVAEALAGWQAVPHRLCPIFTDDGMLILDDAYNANPASMQAALDTLLALSGSSMAVLGDMAELGSDSAAAHRMLDISGVDHVLLVGTAMRVLADRVADCHWCANVDDALVYLHNIKHTTFDAVLVKASRSMNFERIVAMLVAEKKE